MTKHFDAKLFQTSFTFTTLTFTKTSFDPIFALFASVFLYFQLLLLSQIRALFIEPRNVVQSDSLLQEIGSVTHDTDTPPFSNPKVPPTLVSCHVHHPFLPLLLPMHLFSNSDLLLLPHTPLVHHKSWLLAQSLQIQWKLYTQEGALCQPPAVCEYVNLKNVLARNTVLPNLKILTIAKYLMTQCF